MNRYYCFPDIHGMSDVLRDALEYVYSENPEGGKIIFLGDYIDRGHDNWGTLETVMNPPTDWEFVTLLGNHEAMFLDAVDQQTNFYDDQAAKDIAGYRSDQHVATDDVRSGIDEAVIEWMSNLKLFHIEGDNVFAHAFYDDLIAPEEQRKSSCIWDRMPDSDKYFNDRQGLYLTHGHTPRPHGPIKAVNRVNLDTGAVFYGRYVIGEYRVGVQGPVRFHEFFSSKSQ